MTSDQEVLGAATYIFSKLQRPQSEKYSKMCFLIFSSFQGKIILMCVGEIISICEKVRTQIRLSFWSDHY